MKHLLFPLIAVLSALPSAHAQDDFLEGLLSSQTSPSGSESLAGPGAPAQVEEAEVGTVTSTSTAAANCPSSGQTTLPLKYVAGLMREKGSSLQLSQDFATSRLHVRGGGFLANCNSMLEWGLRSPTDQFPQYVVELKIKSCGAETCPYKAMEVNAQGQQVIKDISVQPTLDGFKECLKQTGVVSDKGVDSKKMVVRDLDVSFANVNKTAPVWFGSHLPAANALYGKQGERGCYYMESIRPSGFSAYSQEDSDRARLDEQAQLICDSGNYRHIADFVDRYGQYQQTLGSIRDQLIEKDYISLAGVIRKGEKLDTQDFSIIADFQRYMVDPLTTKIIALHEQISKMPQGQERRLKEQELREHMSQLAKYKSSPYISTSDLDKMMAKGMFDEAGQVHAIHITAHNYGRLGATESGVLVTPRVARQRIQNGKNEFQNSLAQRRKEYDVRTGRVTGESNYYIGLARQHRRNIETRTANYRAEINDEIQRVSQPNGYCFKYFRNTQKCVADSMQRIQQLQIELQEYNRTDDAIALELEQKAQQYGQMEEEGRRYIAAQENPSDEEGESTSTPSREVTNGPSVEAPRVDRTAEQQQPLYQFQMPTQQQAMPGQQQFNQYQQYPQQFYGGQMQQPSPYGQPQFGQQQPVYGGASFQWNGGAGASFGQPAFGQPAYGQPAYGQPAYGQPSYGGNMWGGQSPYGQPAQYGQPQFGYGQQGMPMAQMPFMGLNAGFSFF